ncbi:hypothetical protein HK100_004493 [Physocladia obscura]|uniref:Uncharacterized protein n=1 Tax=Physocladia obscura TaxID=109957 RepID=A0AAD5STR8_9FUNG|nr:hypothetical protein HK100_004493 [Physocladia obscura]
MRQQKVGLDAAGARCPRLVANAALVSNLVVQRHAAVLLAITWRVGLRGHVTVVVQEARVAFAVADNEPLERRHEVAVRGAGGARAARRRP